MDQYTIANRIVYLLRDLAKWQSSETGSRSPPYTQLYRDWVILSVNTQGYPRVREIISATGWMIEQVRFINISESSGDSDATRDSARMYAQLRTQVFDEISEMFSPALGEYVKELIIFYQVMVSEVNSEMNLMEMKKHEAAIDRLVAKIEISEAEDHNNKVSETVASIHEAAEEGVDTLFSYRRYNSVLSRSKYLSQYRELIQIIEIGLTDLLNEAI